MQRVVVDPFDDTLSFEVFKALDPEDHLEYAEMTGAGPTPLSAWADWRALQPQCLLSIVLRSTPALAPFAVLAVVPTGEFGVAKAGLLCRNHTRFRREIAEAAVLIRRQLPDFCQRNRINRVEVRASLTHRTARRLIQNLGFRREAALAGFGADGRATFVQYAYVHLE